MPAEVWIPMAVVPGILLFFFALIVTVGLIEKRPVQPYVVPDEGDEYDESKRARAANDQAEDAGYQHGGLCHHANKLLKVRYDFWIAPDRATVAVVGSGTMAKVPVNGIWLWSRPTAGKILCTTNEIGEQDISGAVAQQTWPDDGFRALLRKHDRRLADVEYRPFPAAGPIAGYFDILRARADALVAKGYARYIDPEESVWKYTVKGVLLFYVMGTWVRPFRRMLRAVGIVNE